MEHLFKGLWYSFLILVRICWIPVVVILGIALIARFFGWLSRKFKK